MASLYFGIARERMPDAGGRWSSAAARRANQVEAAEVVLVESNRMQERSRCAVCECPDREILVRQPLEVPDGACTYSGYNIVCCTRCGFLYADSSPGQQALDAHYQAPAYRYAHHLADSPLRQEGCHHPASSSSPTGTRR